MMNPEVAQAVEELRSCFSDAEVVARDTGNGGAIVTIDSVDLGPTYTPQQTWIKFTVGFQYPYSDVYPLFVRRDLTRTDGRSHGTAIAGTSFEGKPVLQVSRRNKRLNPAVDTAALKVTKVIQWLKEQ